jgi:hypothetical protein
LTVNRLQAHAVRTGDDAELTRPESVISRLDNS